MKNSTIIICLVLLFISGFAIILGLSAFFAKINDEESNHRIVNQEISNFMKLSDEDCTEVSRALLDYRNQMTYYFMITGDNPNEQLLFLKGEYYDYKNRDSMIDKLGRTNTQINESFAMDLIKNFLDSTGERKVAITTENINSIALGVQPTILGMIGRYFFKGNGANLSEFLRQFKMSVMKAQSTPGLKSHFFFVAEPGTLSMSVITVDPNNNTSSLPKENYVFSFNVPFEKYKNPEELKPFKEYQIMNLLILRLDPEKKVPIENKTKMD